MLNDWDHILNAWGIINQGILAYLLLRQEGWKKALPFLTHETPESIERKIFSFDEAIQPKFATDAHGVITNVNIAAEKLLGYKKKAIIGKNIEVILLPDDRSKLRASMKKEWSADSEDEVGYMMAVKKNTEVFPAEITLRKKVAGKNSFFIVAVRDRSAGVSKLKRYEQLLVKLKAELNIVEYGEEIGSTGSWVWDLRRNKLKTSKGYRKILGLDDTEEELEPSYLKSGVWPDDMSIVETALKKAFAGEGYDISFRQIRSSDLGLIFVRSIVRPVRDADGVVILMYGSLRFLQTLNIRDEMIPTLKN